jgi:hypothetical protein
MERTHVASMGKEAAERELQTQLLVVPLLARRVATMEKEQTDTMAVLQAEELAMEQEQKESSSVLVEMEGKLMSSFMASMADREAEHAVAMAELREAHESIAARKEIDHTKLLQKVLLRLKLSQKEAVEAKLDAAAAREEAMVAKQKPKQHHAYGNRNDTSIQREASEHSSTTSFNSQANLPGRTQLLVKSSELQAQLGQKYCDEAELLTLLLARGLVRQVRTLEVEIRPLGGDYFKIRLDSASPSVGETKAEVARVQGTEESRQELYRVGVRADGGAVREGDAEAKPLDEDDMLLGDGEVVTMVVKDLPPLVWRTFAEGRVVLSEEGAVARQKGVPGESEFSLTTTGVELTEGKHYWEVELLLSLEEEEDAELEDELPFIGISRPNLHPRADYWHRGCTDGWFLDADHGSLYGNGKEHENAAGDYKQGDRVGVLLDLGDGSLRFFKNGAQHGPGFGAGSVTSPVVAAVQMRHEGSGVRMLPIAQQPL